MFYYRRPQQLFAQFEKQEYILPPEQVSALVIALLAQPERLKEFAVYRQPTQSIREMLVCTHGNVDIACSRFGYPIYQQLRSDAATSQGQLRVWQCSHFGGHRFAPTLIDLPEGRYWGHLEPDILGQLIDQKGELAQLLRF
ncbi:MAG: sucrase ferredoxin [Cyanophyceae cyanobacterium]